MAKKHSPLFLSIVNAAREEIQECVAEDLMDMVKEGAAVIDVREKHEYENGHFKGSIHIGKGVIERDIEKHEFSTNYDDHLMAVKKYQLKILIMKLFLKAVEPAD